MLAIYFHIADSTIILVYEVVADVMARSIDHSYLTFSSNHYVVLNEVNPSYLLTIDIHVE